MIVVAGEALVDLIVRSDGAVDAVPGGGPYNAARAIGRLGSAVAWLGCLSDDRFGRTLEAGLVEDGVSLELAQRSTLPTTLALAELDADGAAAYRFYTERTSAPQLIGRVPLPAGTRAVHLGTLGLVLEPMASTLAALVDELPDDVLLFVDPNCRPTIIPDPAGYRARLARILERADVVKVSADDLVFLRPGQSALDGARWVRSLGRAAVLHTDGAAAVTVLAGAGEPRTVGVPPVRVVDTVGAGDTFGGAALASIVHDGVARGALDESAVLRAAELGVRAASIACTRAGADPPTLAELGGW